MKLSNTINAIQGGEYDKAFQKLYGNDCDFTLIKERYVKATSEFISLYGNKLGENAELHLFSVPGRSEISGNHTDHNHGKVIAASISLDIIAVAAKVTDGEIRIKSEGFPEDTITLTDFQTVVEQEKYKASAIIRGMCDGLTKNGYAVGGYYAYTTSNVLKGSGLSSSAAFEVMVGTILNHLYNNGKIGAVEIAKISQYAENVHFGKPCGLMDQTACAVGGFVAIDFKDPKNPIVEKLSFDLSSHGYSLCIVNTGGNHADLNEDYASIPFEMKSVAKFFGKDVLREVEKSEILANCAAVREKCGDRALLRAIHFCNENDRVTMQTQALKENNIDAFLTGVRESGLSSVSKLQNIFTVKNTSEQGISLALALAGEVLDQKEKTAYRVHGGGFAGTIQAFVPEQYVAEYCDTMEKAFGKGMSYVLRVRLYGAEELSRLL
jgi:Galactokinase